MHSLQWFIQQINNLLPRKRARGSTGKNEPDVSTLPRVRCPLCGQFQAFLCPGFGQHEPGQSLVLRNSHIQCRECASILSQTVCIICGNVIGLTPDVIDELLNRTYEITTSDYEQGERSLEINQRLRQLMDQVGSKIHAEDEKSVIELKGLLIESEKLLESLPERYPFVQPSNVRMQIATIERWLGMAYDNLLNSEQAISHYQRAAHLFEQLGKVWEMFDCYKDIASIKLSDEGIIDDELLRLHSLIDNLPEGSYKRIKMLIYLGHLHMNIVDYFEAEKVFFTAEKEFKNMQLFLKDEMYTAEILAETGFPSMSERTHSRLEIENKKHAYLNVMLSSLGVMLYNNLSTIYRDRDFSKVTYYFELSFSELYRQGTDQIFTEQLLKLQYAVLKLVHDLKVLLEFVQMHQEEQIEKQSQELESLLQEARIIEAKSYDIGVFEGATTSCIEQGIILITLRRFDEAIATLLKARSSLKKDHWGRDKEVQVLARLAEVHARKQQWHEVSSFCEEGINLVEMYRYKVTSQYMQSAYLTSSISLYSWGVRAAYELKDDNLMLKWAELSKCRSVLRNQHQAAVRVESQSIQHAEQQFKQVCEQIDIAESETIYLEELRQKRRTLWDLLFVQRFQKYRGERIPTFDLIETQGTLDIDEAILYYYWLNQTTLLIVLIDREQCISVLRLLSSETQDALKKFASIILQPPDYSLSQSIDLRSYLERVQDFSTLLLPLEARSMLIKKRRLLISPHRVLHALPFHALQWEGDFLIRRFAVTYVPNLSSLLIHYTPAEQQDMFTLGVSNYNVPGIALKPLKQAEQEVVDIQQICTARSVSVVALKGSDARREKVRQMKTTGKLEEFTCLHFATHGVNVNSDTPMESCLFLRDAQLDGLEIANWRLKAEVVVLSACCSGQRPVSGRGMQELPGDDLFGLQAAFFCAGAKRILSCLWPVVDSVAAQLIGTFHHYLMDGEAPELALQAAVKEYLNTADFDQVDIFYWAPFFLSAMGRPVK